MTDVEDMSSWPLMHGDVSAAQIKAAYQKALAARTNEKDRAELEAATRRILGAYGDSWERLAEAWTIQNWRREYARELHRKTWLNRLSPEEQEAELRALIAEHPLLAREILGERDAGRPPR
ncbi:hypothetical protein ACIBEJ_48560 [Nonomuraea sp. NPDC050790]|uniref:hypothetical protein n=1 Tax=Nonomuraea sp. NPDC050790 TaxID=3364371 RepID=UPI0037B702DC